MIDFNKTFGKGSTETSGNSNNGSAQPKAQFWLNIGYVAEGAGKDGDDAFVSLPLGIPLDTQEPVSTRSNNDDYRAFMAARNDLLEQVMAAAEQLQPGEDRILNLQIQVRRVNGEQAPVERDENRFARSLQL